MVIVSNGFDKFHLATAAAELHRQRMLSLLITGAYPSAAIRHVAGIVAGFAPKKIARLRARSEDLPDRIVKAQWLPEATYRIATRVCSYTALRRIQPAVATRCLEWYGRTASRQVQRTPTARVYHFRAGFGQGSVAAARRLGMVTLCDHSIVHPALLRFLVENGGRLPDTRYSCTLDAFWDAVLRDIDRADAVLANSDFVKETLIRQGVSPGRVHVIYWGIDEQFRNAVPARPPRTKIALATDPLRLLFAGSFERRKGVDVLVRALEECHDFPWRLTIAGDLSQVARREHGRFLRDPRVTIAGPLLRPDLAREMTDADVFVFPSLAEGSARVVFEALACGCYVITTPNTGSIVEDGIHGRLVAPGDARALEAALRRAASERPTVGATGMRNAALIDFQYRQCNYGEALMTLYERLLSIDPAPNRQAREARYVTPAKSQI
jgi:glycosyltransferase involved in cell wall biosynthesis